MPAAYSMAGIHRNISQTEVAKFYCQRTLTWSQRLITKFHTQQHITRCSERA
jgi:hypothetical protein